LIFFYLYLIKWNRKYLHYLACGLISQLQWSGNHLSMKMTICLGLT